jgi:drug/metabolite transporter (DMT)-like permease
MTCPVTAPVNHRAPGSIILATVSVVSYPLAVIAALLFGVSATLQQSSARATRLRAAPPRSGQAWLPVVGELGRLARQPRWLAGWALNVTGFVAHALALHLGSITVVQSILAVQLMFALAATTIVHRQRFLARDWAGAVAVSTGAALVVLARGEVTQVVPAPTRVAQIALVAVVCIVTIVAVARRLGDRTQLRSAVVATGAGIAFCTTAIFVVVITDGLARGGVVGALRWPLPALIVSAVIGSLLVQDSFASGSLPTALTTMTVTDPVVSCLVGLTLFDAVRPAGAGDVVALLSASALIAVGAVLLANSPNLRDNVAVA